MSGRRQPIPKHNSRERECSPRRIGCQRRNTSSKDRERKRPSDKERNEVVQRDIFSVKSHLKTSLSAACDDSLKKENVTSNSNYNDHSNSNIDLMARQDEINRIEEAGFQQSSFKSDIASSRNKKHACKKSQKSKEISSTHDRAMFGPSWMKKELEQSHNQTPPKNDEVEDSNLQPQDHHGFRYPLAHELLFQDQLLRNQRWKELFKERRKMATDGLL